MNESGYLTVSVKTAGGALPVSDAVVTVKDENGNILYVVFTDESGRTPRLKLAAPPLANSGSPDAPRPPFYTYNVDTDKAGYISVRNLGLPVYPGITSIQPVELLPLAEGTKNGSVSFTEGDPPSL